MSAVEIRDEWNLTCGVNTLRRRLREHILHARSPCKVPLLKKNQVAKVIKLSRICTKPSDLGNRKLEEHTDQQQQIWTDEPKVILYGVKGSLEYVRHPPNTT